ncbi:pilus assembly protein CpaE [Actinobacteria bacterium YIM 96077]|uniref:Pilus assembly protein CpaE n=1 Tax=Phytoactinopolyspora halophila TaxID=1981511 RepID=A0A329R0L5_9ACTN|nr:pilus assembly protein CpaE [Phytoactinopolyspora halophila]AYY11451.1 pilus assembly protein CpaE [Actinobacteria bacterium YIM 96077]RAW18067.1 pilus assembly protein CpaE [Phytoactinopolyspora halophila]
MISVELARRLRDAGLQWEPRAGDHFVLPDRDMDDDVFVVSTMVVDVHEFPSGRVIGFNGTVEWALDSVEKDVALWLPTEAQLRELLGGAFVQLARQNGQYAVTLNVDGKHVVRDALTAEEAYGRALLYLAAGE